MSADNENPTRWYQPPVDERRPEWPQNVVPGDKQLGPFRGKYALIDGGAPTLYRADTLIALADAVDDAVLAQLNAGLAPQGWSIARGAPGRGGEVTLDLSAAHGEPDALPALQQLRSVRAAPGTSPAVAAAIDGLALQRFYFIGMPAQDGHAGAYPAALPLVALPARDAADRGP